MSKQVKPVTITRYSTLEDCFKLYMKWDKIDEIDYDIVKYSYWSGYDGGKQFKINIGKWLKNPGMNCWGWAEYRTKSIHIWVSNECDIKELIGMLAHESAHLRRPQYKDRKEEEKKADRSSTDAIFAYEVANEIMNK